jgi:hypothetical protein
MAKAQQQTERQKAPYVTPTIRTIDVSEVEKRGLENLLNRPQQPETAVVQKHPS